MNSFLLNRQLGSISPPALATAQNSRLLQSLQAAPTVHFALHTADSESSRLSGGDGPRTKDVAHGAGVNSIAIDRFEGR